MRIDAMRTGKVKTSHATVGASDQPPTLQEAVEQLLSALQGKDCKASFMTLEACPNCAQRFGVEAVQPAPIADRRHHAEKVPSRDPRLERRSTLRRSLDSTVTIIPARLSTLFQCMACDYEWTR